MDSDDQTDTPGQNANPARTRKWIKSGVGLLILAAVYAWWADPFSMRLPPEPASKWQSFVSVDGQPMPVPTAWIATPEGRAAHAIELPEPLSEDSGYRRGMSSKEYWEHLCKTEAGEFIYRTVDNVEGFYFMRPPNRPTDDDLKDRYTLEAPEIQSIYQLFPATPEERSKAYVNPPWALFRFVEEPNDNVDDDKHYLRMHGYSQKEKLPMQTEKVSNLSSQYGLVWRGVRRPHDRELAIAGSEWIVIDIRTSEVLAVQRNFALTGWARKIFGGIWWLTASGCPNVLATKPGRNRYYDFVSMVVKPDSGDAK